MDTTKLRIKGGLTLCLVAILSGYGVAAERLGDQRTMSDQPPWEWGVGRQDAPQSPQDASETRVGTNLHRASRIRGSTLRNSQGEKLGSVYDLVLTPDLDGISYAVVSTGGFFGIGRQLHAVPWSAIETGIDGKIAAPISAREFAQDRGFTDWPTEGNPRWLSRAGERTEEVTFGVTRAADRESIQNRRFSRIRGMVVRGPQDRSIGTLQDLVVSTDSGRVAYSVVSFGGLFGLGQQYAAVPITAIDIESEQRLARVDVDRQALEAYAFSPNAFPNLSDPMYAQQLNRVYGLEGYDTVLGYVPAEEPGRATTPRTPATASGARGAIAIDPAAPYNTEAARTIQGVVTAVEKTPRTGAGPDHLLLHIRSDTGETHFVHAGPLDYVSKQDFFVVNGDRVTVTGAPARAEDGSAILAARIAKDDQELQVRNREGKPLWEDAAKSHGEHHSEADSSSSEYED